MGRFFLGLGYGQLDTNSFAEVINLRWSHIVGQFGSEVKVYSGC